MSRYDGLIIPRSYNEYINKSDPLTLAQALQQNNVLSGTVAAGDNKAVKSNAVYDALANYDTKGNQSVITKTDANLCIPSEQTETINYIAYGSNRNLPTNDASYFIRTQRSSSYIVQVANSVQNALTKTEADYTRKAKLSGETWTFSPWEKAATESDLTNILKTKAYTNVTPSDNTNKFYEIPTELNGKKIVRVSAPTNITARLYGYSPLPKIRFFDYTDESAPVTVNAFTVYYLD